MTITKDMTIEEILSNFPQKSQRLATEITKAGLACVGCHAATWETLEAGMLGHGMDISEVERLTNKLNQILLQESDPSTISLTKRAAEKYLAILEEDGRQNFGLRFSEEPAGCSGLEYVLDYSEFPDENDTIFESHGVKIHVKTTMLGRLQGSEIDYIDGLNGGGFKISNPNVKSSCGCGNSHGY
jgi:iron-sulfur cluster assembly protein